MKVIVYDSDGSKSSDYLATKTRHLLEEKRHRISSSSTPDLPKRKKILRLLNRNQSQFLPVNWTVAAE
ncbi:hypothetical protein U0070_009337 [Myodes glareolus]|uniref:Uncharacterized protein n=1 Tax=Myodes glareolus TaxID=447135 RepID=A0AAW0HQR4_MYOGA